MPRHLFITGTDTEIGKTHVTCAVLRALTNAGKRATGMKPVAAGAVLRDGKYCNDDLQRIQAAVPRPAPLIDVNQYLLVRPSAPTFAAASEGIEIVTGPIIEGYARLQATHDHVLVEGVGGWMVPLADGVDLRDLVQQLSLPVLLVVGLRLGCINHARLTARAIEDDGVPCLGWISNQVDPEYPDVGETLEALRRLIPSPCLGHVANEHLISTGQADRPTCLGGLMEALLN